MHSHLRLILAATVRVLPNPLGASDRSAPMSVLGTQDMSITLLTKDETDKVAGGGYINNAIAAVKAILPAFDASASHDTQSIDNGDNNGGCQANVNYHG